MATLFQETQFFDNNGNPLSLGKLYWYQAGTSTPKDTWKDEAETALHTNPIILDANGRPPLSAIFIRGSYKLIIKNSDDTITYATIDNINEYDSVDLTGLTASVSDLNSTTTTAKSVLTTPYTVLLADRGKTLIVDASTAPITINLPSAVTVGDTYKIWIKKVDLSTNIVTIIPYGSQTIDGVTSTNNFVLYDYNDFIELRSDGSNWKIGGVLVRGTISTLSANTTLTLAHCGMTFNVDATTASFTITLPSCVSVGRGFWVAFKKIDSSVNIVTLQVATGSSDEIDGKSSYAIDAQWHYAQVKTDGVNWFLLEESGSSTEAVTGDVKASLKQVQNGWVYMNEGTIGNASSGGTTRANADTKELFELIYNVITDGDAPLQDSAGGAKTRVVGHAEIDFNANYRISLPKATGRAIVGMGVATGTGTFTKNWRIGEPFGEENHLLTVTELPAHHHSVEHYTDLNNGGGGEGAWSNITMTVTGDTGGDTAHNTLQPSTAYYLLIKL